MLAMEMKAKMEAKRSNLLTLNLVNWYLKEMVKEALVKHRFEVAMEEKNNLFRLAIGFCSK